jgi:hypothetical protein
MQLRVFALMASQHTLSALMHFEMRISQWKKKRRKSNVESRVIALVNQVEDAIAGTAF